MLETVDTTRRSKKDEYKEWAPRLKEEWRGLVEKAQEANAPVVVLLEGWDTAGKGDSIKQLTDTLDPRSFAVHMMDAPRGEERTHPWLRRYIARLPPRGEVGFFERSWYTRVLRERVEGLCPDEAWARAYQEINQTEEMLVRDGAILIKLWLHITRKQQRRSLEAAEKDPFRQFTVTKREWDRHKRYDETLEAAEAMLERTSTHYAPWRIIAAADRRYRRMRVVQSCCEAVLAGLERNEERRVITKGPAPARIASPVLEEMPTILDKVDLSKSLDPAEYKERVRAEQLRLRLLQIEASKRKVPAAIVYEGWDAAGKGGNIRRLLRTLDPRGYRVVRIGKPSPEELARHYLWRFWIHAPRAGAMAIYDRSWYGRVLVERIEGFCEPHEWRRAYQEINEFELQLFHSRMAIAKFWIHISKDEQLRRFKAREADPAKAWKMTDEDWRNRDKWDQYREAVDEMIQRTSTSYAPWTIVEGDCKRWARVRAIGAVCDALESAIRRADGE